MAALNESRPERELAEAKRAIETGLGQAMIDFNHWPCSSLFEHRLLTAYVGVEPSALPPDENVLQLSAMASKGARG